MKLKVTMPTKREFLEEKTIKELRQMAREKDLTGYSKMRKDELIDLVKDNYLKDEITSWSEWAGKRRVGGRAPLKEKFKSNLLIIGVSVCAVAVIVGFVLGSIGIGPTGSSAEGSDNQFVSENYGFSIGYPKGWEENVQDFSGTVYESLRGIHLGGVLKRKGESENNLVYFSVREKGDYTLEDLENSYQSVVENSENIVSLKAKKKEEEGIPAFEYLLKGTTQNRRKGGLYLLSDNYLYTVDYQVSENAYEDYKPDFDKIFNSFTLL